MCKMGRKMKKGIIHYQAYKNGNLAACSSRITKPLTRNIEEVTCRSCKLSRPYKRDLKKLQAKMKKAEEDIIKLFSEMGQECGKKISKMAAKFHPDNVCILPLYRGCMVVLPQTPEEVERGKCTIILYHDPHWMGEEITEQTLPRYKNKLEIYGQRSGANLTLNELIMQTKTMWEWDRRMTFGHNEHMDIILNTVDVVEHVLKEKITHEDAEAVAKVIFDRHGGKNE